MTNIHSDNPTWNLLKKTLPKGFDSNSIINIVSILSVEYNDSSLEEMKKAIVDNNLIAFSKTHHFNSQKDAIELFLFSYKDGIKKMCLLFSPVEFFENEYIIEFLELDYNFEIENFENTRIIFQN